MWRSWREHSTVVTVTRLREAGADSVVSETYHSALEMGAEALRSLGTTLSSLEQQKSTYQRKKVVSLKSFTKLGLMLKRTHVTTTTTDKSSFILEEAMKEDMKKDRSDKHSRSERGWTPPPKGYADGFEEEQQS